MNVVNDEGITMAILDENYEGSPDWRTLYISVATFKSIFSIWLAASAGCEVSLRCWIGYVDELLLEPVCSAWIRSSLCRTEVEASINSEFA